MTPIQPILTLFILIFFLYSMVAAKVSRNLSILLCLASMAGLAFVWTPSLTEILAHKLGVGRGVDLVIYTALSLNSIVLLFLHLRIHRQREYITTLSRKLALRDAKAPNVAE